MFLYIYFATGFEEGQYSLLFVTPETAASKGFRNQIEKFDAEGRICLVCLDEVHCVSTW